MAARDGSPGVNGEAKGPAFSRRPLVFGLSLLAAVAFFDALPTPAQSFNLLPSLNLNLGGGGHYRHYRRYHRHYGGYHRRHYSHRYGHRHHGGGHRHHRGGHHGGGGGGGGGHAPIAPP
jgi:hypothetical protein